MTKILNLKMTLPVKEYVWDTRWISDYESAWSIFEKFRFFNSLSDSDIFKLFGTEVIKRKKSKHFLKPFQCKCGYMFTAEPYKSFNRSS